MIPTLKLSDIISKWRDALQASQPIQNFCTTHYNKAPNIFVGINGKIPPTADNCPLIILYPGAKSEGLELQEYTYKLTIGWTILQTAVTVTNNVTELSGIAECDALGQLIYLELAQLSPDNPVSVLNYDLEPVAYFPRFPGRMEITVKISPVNGYNINF
ncbi:hypothetical protein SPSIL_002530 [Sporomusa silvacetica DSM 10669]|uniref:Uncharacterized protein n=1 Tax=Sporomusa silvacetica DSM 10669 TaxID=1123289 RepID=A0ABZ3IFH4_9FIRM|nr:hypothetical protein [Sporomusa silvacetica]OZC17845.1 hypothetical protein SPSIL_29850 [Sporomusa silvacetica DSM 10669]